MKVQNITDIDKFFEVVDSCEGKVELGEAGDTQERNVTIYFPIAQEVSEVQVGVQAGAVVADK